MGEWEAGTTRAAERSGWHCGDGWGGQLQRGWPRGAARLAAGGSGPAAPLAERSEYLCGTIVASRPAFYACAITWNLE